MSNFKIREIQPDDNQQVAKVVREVLVEMGVPKVGTAYEDKSLDNMYGYYNNPGMQYFVVEEDGRIIGCAGIGPLPGEAGVCELQKMYFLPQARGRGIGAVMMETCLDFARKSGYKKCYLETMPYMQHAQKLYARTGFKPLDGPMGETGHYNCTVWMIKELAPGPRNPPAPKGE
ncbi:GNAT family N-acetyltransferase [Antarcticibacterium flavum]|uniref:GNAT family N-acetyltransferase n=1 Tax=Antarcticibacterium flavum TaxID=2058175 RepID=A0A5B7X564_9FLAO|nr:GNAT family N-acetyltransferase [Antarcticibacterium flavum]QCY70499.1 GNAT family N-acetyltransferase [Antarcticibacterium flavum]